MSWKREKSISGVLLAITCALSSCSTSDIDQNAQTSSGQNVTKAQDGKGLDLKCDGYLAHGNKTTLMLSKAPTSSPNEPNGQLSVDIGNSMKNVYEGSSTVLRTFQREKSAVLAYFKVLHKDVTTLAAETNPSSKVLRSSQSEANIIQNQLSQKPTWELAKLLVQTTVSANAAKVPGNVSQSRYQATYETDNTARADLFPGTNCVEVRKKASEIPFFDIGGDFLIKDGSGKDTSWESLRAETTDEGCGYPMWLLTATSTDVKNAIRFEGANQIVFTPELSATVAMPEEYARAKPQQLAHTTVKAVYETSSEPGKSEKYISKIVACIPPNPYVSRDFDVDYAIATTDLLYALAASRL